MIKRTLYFGQAAYLSLRDGQLLVRLPAEEGSRSIPIEDIGVLILDHQQISITHGLMNALEAHKCALITCSASHMPSGLFLPLDAHSLQSERFQTQIETTLPLKKQLWQQTVRMKIQNQARVLEEVYAQPQANMLAWVKQVRSGDSDNLEARAAAYYWANLFPSLPKFTREREESAPNALLNYGYALLRAVVARSLVSVGLLPTLGIHHHNRYNAYCLADDIMEPYRPYVDKFVQEIYEREYPESLTKDIKHRLLTIMEQDVVIDGITHPLSIATSLTASSLVRCFEGSSKQIDYPVL
jgi:CRISPR-associated endonuclease cas1, NMENI subtype